MRTMNKTWLRLAACICGLLLSFTLPVWAEPVQEDPLDRAVLEFLRSR